MKSTVVYSFAIIFLLSLTQFNLPNAFGGEIDYKKIFKNECQKCHDYNGKGTKRGKRLGVPDFTDGEWQDSVTDEQLINSITNGKNKMPKQEGRLGPEEIKAMVKYVRFFAPKKKR
jgi:mono/diheme cytochrome c family protein